ncbi:MAG: ErfK/YbiS/YcfS/YnhG family protein [uncultured Sulfurovum sp.]|uniref:ErfK/YbiS/YcfS/YnhG family protein n=1 Tax=uncultured Sulfurovum sp. TaxID=269237 RepID=A0A6S6TJA2_9BACT|nr:MAG: ErfK/YbiS/YcfS/YnhG family protein [uncultured Sulfurovum sp.]
MQKKIVLVILGILVFTGCNEKVKIKVPEPKVVEPIVEVEEEIIIPEKSVFDWQQNDELIKTGEATKMVAVKSKRVLVLFDKEGDVLSRHRLSLGENPVGTKLKQGDKKTPVGTYSIRDIRGDKKYYKEILISYPNHEDKQRSKKLGHNPGGGITFHAQVPWNWNGSGDDHTLANDWTEGCLALTNHGMNTVLSMISHKTVVEIRE